MKNQPLLKSLFFENSKILQNLYLNKQNFQQQKNHNFKTK